VTVDRQDKVDVLGVVLTPSTIPRAVERIGSWIEQRHQTYVCVTSRVTRGRSAPINTQRRRNVHHRRNAAPVGGATCRLHRRPAGLRTGSNTRASRKSSRRRLALLLLWRRRGRRSRARTRTRSSIPGFCHSGHHVTTIPTALAAGRDRHRGRNQLFGCRHRVGWAVDTQTGTVDGRLSRPARRSGLDRRRRSVRLPDRTSAPGSCLDSTQRVRMVVSVSDKPEAPLAALPAPVPEVRHRHHSTRPQGRRLERSRG